MAAEVGGNEGGGGRMMTTETTVRGEKPRGDIIVSSVYMAPPPPLATIPNAMTVSVYRLEDHQLERGLALDFLSRSDSHSG